MKPIVLAIAALGLLCLTSGRSSAAAGAPGQLQEAPRLTWLTPGFLPERGLLTIGFRGSRYHPGYNPTGGPAHYDVVQGTLFVDWSPSAWLSASVAQSWRGWSNYLVPGQPETGFGLADGGFRLVLAQPGLPDWLGFSVWGGGNLPTGMQELSEDAFSPDAGVSLSASFWRVRQIPELRLHLSFGRRWNGNEQQGYGTGQGPLPQPWFPLYPSAADAGGASDRNDFLFWAAALEFRKAAAALWVEYSVFRLDRAVNVATSENQQILSAGLRWGLRAGWAVHADYQVGFHMDDRGTLGASEHEGGLEPTPWYPRLPHIGFTLAVSRQFALGWP